MGVNTRISLPPSTNLDDVVLAMGILAGLPITENEFGLSVNGTAVSSYKTPGLATCVRVIMWGDGCIDGQNHDEMYHLETPGGRRGLFPPSSPFWIAMANELVNFFGGWVIAQDSDGIITHRVDDKDNATESEVLSDSNIKFYNMKNRFRTLKPLTREDIIVQYSNAAYDTKLPPPPVVKNRDYKERLIASNLPQFRLDVLDDIIKEYDLR